MRSSAFVLSIGMAVASAAPAVSAPSNPYDALLPSRKGASTCFVRRYTDAHLQSHPAQKIAEVILSLSNISGGSNLMIGLRRKGESRLHYASGGCVWNDHANRDIHDKPIIKDFRKDAGADCMMVVSPNSAEEGAGVVLDPAPDGRSLTLYTDTILAVVTGRSDHWVEGSLPLGTADRVFRLDRVNPSECAAMDRL